MVRKNIVDSIEKLVSSGSLKQPFTVSDVNKVGSNLLEKSPSFLSKHCKGNPGKYNEYFKRVSRGKYECLYAS